MVSTEAWVLKVLHAPISKEGVTNSTIHFICIDDIVSACSLSKTVNLWILRHKKDVGTHHRCQFHIRRPSHCPELLNEATQSPRRYEYNIPSNVILKAYSINMICYRSTKGMRINTSRGHSPLHCSDNPWKLRSFLTSRTKRYMNALYHVVTLFPTHCPPYLVHPFYRNYHLRLGVGCLYNKTIQNTSAMSNQQKTSRVACKDNK